MTRHVSGGCGLRKFVRRQRGSKPRPSVRQVAILPSWGSRPLDRRLCVPRFREVCLDGMVPGRMLFAPGTVLIGGKEENWSEEMHFTQKYRGVSAASPGSRTPRPGDQGPIRWRALCEGKQASWIVFASADDRIETGARARAPQRRKFRVPETGVICHRCLPAPKQVSSRFQTGSGREVRETRPYQAA